MARRVVYLDHSVLSNLAKAQLGILKEGVWLELLQEFTRLVEADKALFPFSWTHHYEAELDSRLEDPIHRVGASLARGIGFHAYAQIVAEQARREYLNFTGSERAKISWREAYEHDPRGDVSERWLASMLGARVTTDTAGRDRRRAIKDYSARSLSADRDARSWPSYEAAKQHYAQEAVRFYFERPQRAALAGQLTDSVVPMLQFSGRVADAAYGLRIPQRTPAEVIAGLNAMFDFFASEQCRGMPFIDLESSILASLEVDDLSRRYSPGDFYDVETWSAYLPYVDMAVADGHMHEVLNRRGLAARFDCSVFPNTADGLRRLTAKLKLAD
ncbi:MAG: hypothetical protein A2148_00015 [Chloroflexi bacterium RBG_16_68_14]|nr:MAG: hypothetical protein A2148_00015 [Chloroflexi bacterium RBG_16_68_14]